MDSLKATTSQESRLHFLDYWRIIRIRKTIILAVFLLVFVTATIVTFILPEAFASTTRIKVTRDAPDIPGMESGMNIATYDPYFIQTEFEVMKSEDVLTRVVNALDLNHKWGRKYAGGDNTLKTIETIGLLRQRLDLHPVRNTLLIEITVYSDKPDEAAELANAVAEAYRDNRNEERKRITLGGLTALKDEYAVQEHKIFEAETNVEQFRRDLQITDPESAGTSLPQSFEYAGVATSKARMEEDEAMYDRQLTTLNQLKALTPEKLRMVIPSVEPDTQLMSLLDQINFAQQKLLSLSADIKPGHPTYDSADAMVKYLDKKINERVKGLMTALEQRVTSSKAVVDSRKAHLETAKDTDIKRATETRPYYEAKQKLERLQKFSSILEYKIATTSIDEKLPRLTVVSIIEPARADSTPVRPKKTLNIILGIVIGLVVGIGLAFFIEYLDTSVKTIDDVERALQAPVLGVIPQNVGLLLNEGAESPHAEAYRVLRTNLLFSRKDEKLNTVCVVSAGAGEGKSTTILNLATVFAQSGQRVLLVDSDLRRPTLHKMLKVSNNLGLTNCLLKQNSLEEVIQTTSLPMLDILPSGKLPSSSLGILSSAQMRDLITELKRRYDFVLFDSPPIMGVSDASILASEVDMTIQVIQYRRYPQPMNIRAKQMVEKVGGNLVGIVLNNINMSQDESYYYYSGYYHGYYYSRDEEQVVPAGKTEGRVGEKPAEIKQKY
jgi:succinoglycan biosynthesis transport protein ExoP